METVLTPHTGTQAGGHSLTETVLTPPTQTAREGTSLTALRNITDTSDHSAATDTLKALTVHVYNNGPNRKRKRPSLKKGVTSSQQPAAGRKRRSTAKAIDQNICQTCGSAFIPGEEDEWVGCDYCARWFHAKCVTPTVDCEWKCPFH